MHYYQIGVDRGFCSPDIHTPKADVYHSKHSPVISQGSYAAFLQSAELHPKNVHHLEMILRAVV